MQNNNTVRVRIKEKQRPKCWYQKGDEFDVEDLKDEYWLVAKGIYTTNHIPKFDCEIITQYDLKKGDRIILKDVGTKEPSTYDCDKGTFIRYEKDLVMWESNLGGIYVTPKERVIYDGVRPSTKAPLFTESQWQDIMTTAAGTDNPNFPPPIKSDCEVLSSPEASEQPAPKFIEDVFNLSEKINAASEQGKEEGVKKPPLGIMPKFIWQEQRLQDLINAMDRYGIAGYKIPEEWITEYQELNDIVKHPHRTPKPEAWATDEDIREAFNAFNGGAFSEWLSEYKLQLLKTKQP